MELFYAEDVRDGFCRLGEEESCHCVRVLRHRSGDPVNVIDGRGTLMQCRIVDDSPKSVEAEVLFRIGNWNSHPYRLTMAVCPTKNMDRFEWFAEKATEIGVDVIVPLIGDRSERRAVKTQRLEKIVLSAAKQSLKGAVPEVAVPETVRGFVASAGRTSGSAAASSSGADAGAAASCGQGTAAPLRLIACCFEDSGHPRRSVKSAVEDWLGANFPGLQARGCRAYEEDVVGTGMEELPEMPEIVVLIGPEGDFSQEEVQLAISSGFIPVHLGPSRLRTETAALLCVESVYGSLMLR